MIKVVYNIMDDTRVISGPHDLIFDSPSKYRAWVQTQSGHPYLHIEILDLIDTEVKPTLA